MGSGIEIYNNSNTLQITDMFNNLQFISKGTVGNGGSVTTLLNEILAFRCDDGHWFSIFPDKSFTSTTVTTPISSNGTVYWYKFGFTNNLTGNHFEVRKSDGTIAFSDSSHYMKVLDSKAGLKNGTDYTHALYPQATTPYTSEKKVGVVAGILSSYLFFQDMGRTSTVTRLMFLFNSSLLSSSYVNYDVTSQSFPQISNSYNYLVIDVTNL